MLFNSFEFLFVFFPIMFFGYYYLLNNRFVGIAKIWLIIGSLFFYGWWNPLYLPLILISIFINYLVSLHLRNNTYSKPTRRSILIFGIFFNLGLLAYFKYMDFFITNLNNITNSNIELLNIVLPLAISFFTFQQVAYIVDSYKKVTTKTDILTYILFVTFFPQLIAGPIVHYSEMMPQFASKWNCTKKYRNIALGLFIFSIGLFKKVMIADSFAIWSDKGFDIATKLNFLEAWATSLSYTFQIYFDFSGYTDMAIGIALLFNIKLPINFSSPYKALNIQDFWRRWHITLSRFLREYLYLPLGGNRVASYRVYSNLFIVFFLGGLWHGASWMFVIWGSLHGIAMIIHKIWMKLNCKMWAWFAWLLTFNFINITWIFFRANDIESAKKILVGMLGINSILLPKSLEPMLVNIVPVVFNENWFVNVGGNGFLFLVILPITFIVILFSKNTMEIKNNVRTYLWSTSIFSAFLLLICILEMNKVSKFLYFNF